MRPFKMLNVVLLAFAIACDAPFDAVVAPNGGSTSPSGSVVAAVSLPRNLPALTVGQSTQIAAVVKDGAGNVLSTAAVSWSSSSSSVATVSASGVVTAQAPGNATVK